MRRTGLLMAAVLAACGGDGRDAAETAAGDGAAPGSPPAAAASEVATTYAPGLNVDLEAMNRSESGLYWQDGELGAGDAAATGETVRVHYTGWLADGTVFDSSYERGEPIAFPLGAGRVIQGWDEGVAGLRVGGTRRLVIPPHLGYGARAIGPIPPNSTLVFDIELVEIVR
jgi:FKBP-type peptidyl-prolyl cis-trans isomerase